MAQREEQRSEPARSQESTAERRARLALLATPEIGPATLHRLLEEAGSAQAILERPQLWLAAKLDVVPAPEELLRRAAQQWASLAAVEAGTLARGLDEDYPPELENLHCPPAILAFQGNPLVLGNGALRVATVGARACTPYGRDQARRIGSGLAAAGVVVVSGAARGIDQAAMEGAVEAGGKVVAILGSGIDRPYPPEARPLLERILERGGVLLSEFPCGAAPQRSHFPQRNRLLAALARGVLVVQATDKSGSMITVRWALELGREVLAVPGPVDSVVSRGPHSLLRDGAALVESAQDVIRCLTRAGAPEEQERQDPLLAKLAGGDRTIDDLARSLQLPVGQIQMELAEWELRGRVTRLPGGLYHDCQSKTI